MDVQRSEEELAKLLSGAIYSGDVQTAQNIVVQLANLHLKLNIDIVPEQNESAVEKPFKITIQVEDRESAGASFELLVRSTDKIGDLKKRVSLNYKFPEEVQRWIIGKRIQDDNLTLARVGVRSATTIFVYLLPAHTVGLTRQPENSGGYVDETFDTLHGPFEKSLSLDIGRPEHDAIQTLLTAEDLINKSPSHPDQFDYNNPCEEEDEFSSYHLYGYTENNPMWVCPKCTYKNPTADPVCEVCRYSTQDGDPEEVRAVEDEDTGLNLGDRVVWPSDKGEEKGTVRWIGTLPDVEGGQITVGVEFDNPVGVGTGMYKDQQLFVARASHAALVPLGGLVKDFGE